MGMDIYGRKPRAESGKYFRMTISAWPILWQYCEAIAPDIIPKDNGGYYNDGWGLNDTDSLKLAHRLQEWFERGDCEVWKEEVEQAHTKLVSIGCQDCTAIKQIIEPDADKELSIDILAFRYENDVSAGDQIPSVFNNSHNDLECGTCGDTGIKSYRVIEQTFAVDAVPLFIEFLLNCGGFKIW